MKLVSSLGALAGAFLLLPKGSVTLALIWTVGKFSPIIGWAMFAVFLVSGGGQ